MYMCNVLCGDGVDLTGTYMYMTDVQVQPAQHVHTHVHAHTQLHSVLEESDRALAVVKDLFGDDPKVYV